MMTLLDLFATHWVPALRSVVTRAPLLLGGLLFTACASPSYKAPMGQVQEATVTLMNQSGGFNHARFFTYEDDRKCLGLRAINIDSADDFLLRKGGSSNITVLADRRFTLIARNESNHCTAAAEFLPKPMTKYRAKFLSGSGMCMLRILRPDTSEAGTDETPEPTARYRTMSDTPTPPDTICLLR